MTDLLILHLTIAFLVGGAWVSFATLIAERYGSALGGLVGGLPAISVVSFLFIGINQGPETASQAAIVFPLALTFTVSFLVAYAALSKRGFRVAFPAGLIVWAILSVITALLNLRNLFLCVGVFVSVSSFYFYMLKIKMKLPNVPGAEKAYSSRRGVQSDRRRRGHRSCGALEPAWRTRARLVLPHRFRQYSASRSFSPTEPVGWHCRKR